MSERTIESAATVFIVIAARSPDEGSDAPPWPPSWMISTRPLAIASSSIATPFALRTVTIKAALVTVLKSARTRDW